MSYSCYNISKTTFPRRCNEYEHSIKPVSTVRHVACDSDFGVCHLVTVCKDVIF